MAKTNNWDPDSTVPRPIFGLGIFFGRDSDDLHPAFVTDSIIPFVAASTDILAVTPGAADTDQGRNPVRRTE